MSKSKCRQGLNLNPMVEVMDKPCRRNDNFVLRNRLKKASDFSLLSVD